MTTIARRNDNIFVKFTCHLISNIQSRISTGYGRPPADARMDGTCSEKHATEYSAQSMKTDRKEKGWLSMPQTWNVASCIQAQSWRFCQISITNILPTHWCEITDEIFGLA